MWEVPLGPQQSENVINNIMEQTSKQELAQYLHTSIFSPTKSIILAETKKVSLKTWPSLTENIIKKHLSKSRNTTIGNLHMRRQGLHSTKYKPHDIDLEDKIKKM